MKTLLAALLLAPLLAGAADTRPPSIIFILADDMGWGDASCYGHPYAKTPNIDRLAREGTRFTQFYATGVTCCPSRTGFMTSRWPASYATYPANGGFSGRVTITELLKKRGYATGHFGKWHIGPEMKPGTYGIDAIGHDDDRQKQRRQDVRGRDAHIYDDAIRFIEQHKDEPFYVNVWGHIAHHPVNPSPGLRDAFGPLAIDESKFPPEMREKFALCRKLGGDVNEHLRAYLADVKSMDDDVGRLLARLDALRLRDNTIVVFSSDQGPAPMRDAGEAKKKNERDTTEVRLNAMGFAGPFRGSKHNQYEGGVRIPFIVRWPGQVKAGRVDEKSVISGADWLPTLCAITGTMIDAADFVGEDASRAWRGADFTRTKPLLWKTSSAKSPAAIRDGQWKLHFPNSKRSELELYDIAADPGEKTNLAARQPDIVKRLSAQIEAWQATLPKEYDKTDDKD
jgi:N-acetylgalactosamine-6-sulfatase